MNTSVPLNDIPLGGAQAVVTRWLIQVGERVEVGQPLAVLLGERAEFAIPAEQAGEISSLSAAEGAVVRIGETLATFASAVDNVAPTRISPLARRIAGQHDMDIANLIGSGPGGRILKRDVLAQIRGQGSGVRGQEATVQGAEERGRAGEGEKDALPLYRFTALPLALAMVEADFSAVQAACKAYSTPQRVAVDERACIAMAVAEALRQHPQYQARWSEAGLVVRRRIVLAVERNGVLGLVPDAQDLNVRGIARALATQQEAQTATLHIRLQPSTEWAGQGIAPALTVGKIGKRPVVVGSGQSEHIAIRPIARLAFQYDARVLSQREADSFLRAVAQRIEWFMV